MESQCGTGVTLSAGERSALRMTGKSKEEGIGHRHGTNLNS